MSKEGHHDDDDNEICGLYVSLLPSALLPVDGGKSRFGGRLFVLPGHGFHPSETPVHLLQTCLSEEDLPLLRIGQLRLLSNVLASLAVSAQLCPLPDASDCAYAVFSNRGVKGSGEAADKTSGKAARESAASQDDDKAVRQVASELFDRETERASVSRFLSHL